MVSLFSWVLLIVAVLDVFYALAQLFMFDGMRIIIQDMTVGQKWLVAVGPSSAVLVLGILAVAHHELSVLWLLSGAVALVVVIIYQITAQLAINDKFREWDEQVGPQLEAVSPY